MLWANLHLLFWLSLVPFVTGWMGENHFAALPTAVYGVVLLMAGDRLHRSSQTHADLRSAATTRRWRAAIGSDIKGKLSAAALRRGDPARLRPPRGSPIAIYVVVALMWLVPDRRIERVLAEHHEATAGGGSHH